MPSSSTRRAGDAGRDDRSESSNCRSNTTQHMMFAIRFRYDTLATQTQTTRNMRDARRAYLSLDTAYVHHPVVRRLRAVIVDASQHSVRIPCCAGGQHVLDQLIFARQGERQRLRIGGTRTSSVVSIAHASCLWKTRCAAKHRGEPTHCGDNRVIEQNRRGVDVVLRR